MYQKNDELIATVVATGANGEGIIKDENFVIFVPFCLPQEKVKIKLLKVEKKYAYGKLIEVIEPSPFRVKPFCEVFGKCGGCQLQHVNYDKQIEIKKRTVLDAFVKVAGINIDINDVVCGSSVVRYRNKLQLPVTQTDKGLQIGFYAENSHRVVPVSDCPINPVWTSDIIKCLTEYMQKNNLNGYDEFNHTGDVREITAREVNGSLIITLVCLKKSIKNVNDFVEILKQRIDKEFTLYLNINDLKTNVIYGEKFVLVHGKSEYDCNMLTIKHSMGVRSFMQVNDEVCAKLYSKVKDSIDFDKTPVVIDAYSGAGLMTAYLALDAKKAFGIEIIPEAVAIANKLAKRNGLEDRITNYLGKCEDILPNLVQSESKLNDVCVVLDPPRKGCDIKVIKALLTSNVSRIVYVSCKPQTLARDIGLLMGSLMEKDGILTKNDCDINGVYKVDEVTMFDMFPNTKHVESIACLSRK